MPEAGGQEAGDYELVIRHLDGWARHAIPVSRAAGGEFSVEADVGAIDNFGARAPLRDGRWEAGLRRAAGAAGDDAPLTLRASIDPRPSVAGRKTFRCGSGDGGGGLVITVAPRLGPLEGGRIRRRLLREVYYRVQRRLPVRDTALFISFDGRSCTDNPLGIARELRRRGGRLEQLWAVDDWSVAVPPGGRAVLIGTAGYLAALGRSAYVIANDHVALPYRRRAGQRYVQTWHGTPLKRLGWDIVKPSFVSGDRYFEFLAGDVAQWDLLISPNPFTTPIMAQAFRYTGEIAETGYPRDDALLAGRRPT